MARTVKSIYDLFSNYSKKQINLMVSTLNEKETNLLKLRYGSDLENPDFRHELTNEERFLFYKWLVPKMRRRLKNGSKYRRIPQEKTFNIYDYFYNYSKQEIDCVICGLKKYEQRLLKMYCGDKYDGNNQNYHMTEKEKKYFLSVVLPNINKKLSKTFTPVNHVVNKYKQLTIYEYFDNYSKEQIDAILNVLSDNNKKLLELKFINDDSELGIQKEMSAQQRKQCSKLIDKIKKYLDNDKLDYNNLNNTNSLKSLYKRFNQYSKEDIDKVIELLPEEDKKLLELRYGKDLLNPVVTENWDKESAVKFNTCLIPKIKKMLKNHNYAFSNGRAPISIYRYFSKYKREQINNVILKLNEEEKRLFDLKYGDNLDYPFTNPNMTKKEKTDFEIVKNKMAKLLQNPSIAPDSYKLLLPEIYKHFNKYEKKHIDEVLADLTETERELLQIKFGTNININSKKNDINIEQFHKLFAKIRCLLEEKKNMAVLIPRKRLKSIYECFSEYDKSQLDAVIAELSPEERNLLYLNYGEDLANPVSKNHMTQEQKGKFRYLISLKIQNELQKKFPKESSYNVTEQKKQEDILIYLTKLLYTNDYSYLLDDYSIKEAMVIVLKFGFIKNKFYSIRDIATMLKIESDEVSYICKNYLLSQKERLEREMSNNFTLKK